MRNLVASLFAFLVVSTTVNAQSRIEILRDVNYGTGGGRALRLDIIRPIGPPAGLMPAVVWIHGGAWRFGDKNNPPTAQLAARGYFTISINYRLSNEARFPAAVEDSKCAVRWLRANAALYHVDPTRIGVWGASAGGHLAEFLATTAEDPQFEGRGGYNDQSSRVQAVVSFFGPSDFTRDTDKFEDGRGTAVMDFLGGRPAELPDVYRAASPVTHVTKASAPTLLVHGDHDTTVPVEQSIRMAEAMKAAGAEFQFIVVKNGVHGFFINNVLPISPTPAEIHAAVIAWFDKHLKPK